MHGARSCLEVLVSPAKHALSVKATGIGDRQRVASGQQPRMLQGVGHRDASLPQVQTCGMQNKTGEGTFDLDLADNHVP